MPAGTSAHVVRPDELDAVVELLVDAFHDDPTWSWVFPDPALRSTQHRRLWRLMVEGAARYPCTWLNGDSTATSVWIPPNGTELSEAQEALLEALLVELLGREAGRARVAFEQFEQAHPRAEPHYYLSLLATSTGHRGRGLGLALLETNLREIDETAMPCYLEASNPANVALYQRYGFEPIGAFTLPAGPEVATMWRPPRPGSADR
jgi:ribosomal protein S18 acetylase RimI-like enzyme